MILNQETIKQILRDLFQKRNYISEADLRINFVIELDKVCHPKYVVANFPIKCEDKTLYEDLRVIDEEGNAYIIMFKYCPSRVPIPFGNYDIETRKRTPKKKRVARFNEDCDQIRQMIVAADPKEKIQSAFCIFITNQKNLTKNTPFPFEELSADFKLCVQEINRSIAVRMAELSKALADMASGALSPDDPSVDAILKAAADTYAKKAPAPVVSEDVDDDESLDEE